MFICLYFYIQTLPLPIFNTQTHAGEGHLLWCDSIKDVRALCKDKYGLIKSWSEEEETCAEERYTGLNNALIIPKMHFHNEPLIFAVQSYMVQCLNEKIVTVFHCHLIVKTYISKLIMLLVVMKGSQPECYIKYKISRTFSQFFKLI